jgi:tRNA(adenine34) deaminase
MTKRKESKYQSYMELALAEARKGIAMGESPYGAVLIVDGKVFSTSHNTVIESNDNLSHAEVIVLREYLLEARAKNLLPKEITLVTTCEPCIKCFTMALSVGVNRFVYGSEIETAIAHNSGDILFKIGKAAKKFQIKVEGKLLEKECDALYDEFQKFTMEKWAEEILTFSSGSEEEIRWMNKALEVGERGMREKHELPIGVILVAGDTLLSESSTMTYTLNSPITHGDYMALQKAERKVYDKDCRRPLVLYSTLEPHLIGFGAAIKCKVDKVVFGLPAYPDGGTCYLKKMVGVQEKLPKVIGGVCEEKQYLLLKEFLATHPEGRVGYDYATNLVNRYEETHKK